MTAFAHYLPLLQIKRIKANLRHVHFICGKIIEKKELLVSSHFHIFIKMPAIVCIESPIFVCKTSEYTLHNR